ncbi:MAG: hypothetical protein HQ462_01770 [Deltaproteobacteria bacterium]|nr:hypothetical protein [Deltaproteobacteria bacterium]
MRGFLVIVYGLVTIGLVSSSLGARLPKGLTSSELDTLIHILGTGNVTKVMRSAEAYPQFPGIKLSLETTLVPSANLNTLGNSSASLPILIPSPRLTLTKGLGMNFEAAINFSTPELLQTIATLGVLAKWTLLNESDTFASSAIFGSYTRLNGFNNTFTGNDFEVGFLSSKDFVRLKPYLGMGLILASATVAKSISPIAQSGTALTPHLFLGAEIELPMTIALQLDFTDWLPSGSFSLGYRF